MVPLPVTVAVVAPAVPAKLTSPVAKSLTDSENTTVKYQLGAALDRYVRTPLIGTALKMMRQPARVAGYSALQDFLERGFAAFRRMGGADEFLAAVAVRETRLHDAIVAGANDPFPDPAG